MWRFSYEQGTPVRPSLFFDSENFEGVPLPLFRLLVLLVGSCPSAGDDWTRGGGLLAQADVNTIPVAGVL